MVCANCGLNNIDGSNFCIGCGHALKAAASDSYVVLVNDLPDSCRARLLEAVKNPPPETFVISESKSGWAMATLIGSVFGIFIVVAQANAYKWQQEEVLIYLAVTVGCFVAGLSALRYLLRFFGADFRAHALINPLYFLRIRFGRDRCREPAESRRLARKPQERLAGQLRRLDFLVSGCRRPAQTEGRGYASRESTGVGPEQVSKFHCRTVRTRGLRQVAGARSSGSNGGNGRNRFRELLLA